MNESGFTCSAEDVIGKNDQGATGSRARQDTPSDPHNNGENHLALHTWPRSAYYHMFEHISLSDNAKAIFGDVYTCCAGPSVHLTPEQELNCKQPQLKTR